MARDYTLNRSAGENESRIDFASELNPQQLAAVQSPPGPSLVIAGAGSGKTRTLTHRVAYLLENGIPAASILLLTFTNKAAKEMLDRVQSLVSQDTSEIWGGTFHSVGNRILRRHANELGWQRRFSIMDREDQKDVMKTVIGESDIDLSATRFPKPEVLADIYSLSQNTSQSITELIEERYPYYHHLTSQIESLQEVYEKKKKDINSMDFDDLLVKTLLLFYDKPAIRKMYQKQFEWVLVDEFQDTNAVQAELIGMLAAPHNNLMVVGDDAQSIYSWRGADFRNILEFQENYEDARKFVIETNYRSVPGILSLANASITQNREQIPKNLAPDRADSGTQPGLVELQSPSEQAVFIAQRLLELRDEGVELNEIAILYRAHFHSMEIQMELTRRGIPFVITSGLRFFEQAHIKDVASFMKLIHNRLDEVAFKRIVNMLPGVGAKSASNLWNQWKASPLAHRDAKSLFSDVLLDFKIPPRAKAGWEQLAYTLDELVDEQFEAQPPAVMMPSIINGVYEDYLQSKYSNYESREQDLQQLAKYSENFSKLQDFLSQLSLLAGQDVVSAKNAEPDPEAVCMSTVHQAKGLEWRAVFLVSLADGMFPSHRVLDDDDAEESGLEEERRLFYVALTRAKDELYLTYPRTWFSSYSGEVLQTPSRFIEELPSDLLEEWKVGASWY